MIRSIISMILCAAVAIVFGSIRRAELILLVIVCVALIVVAVKGILFPVTSFLSMSGIASTYTSGVRASQRNQLRLSR
jgi:hypothetical protein